MQFTANYNFKKPEGNDIVDVTDLNTNAEIIDGILTPAADPTQVPASNGPAKLPQWISWITNRIKAITGKANWYDTPDASLADIVSTAAADKVLKLNAIAKLPASITGDADTVDGKHAADFAAANHTHPLPLFINITTVPDKGKITPTPGYAIHKYFLSLAKIDTYAESYDNSIVTRGSYPNYYTAVSDFSRVGFTCMYDATTLAVTAGMVLDDGKWVSGTANCLEIAWN